MIEIIEVDEPKLPKDILNSSQPVLVDFWAGSNDSCKQFEPTIQAAAAKLVSRLKVVRVDVERNPALTRLCFVQTLPTTLYFVDGLVRDRIVGIENKEAFLLRLEKLLETNWG